MAISMGFLPDMSRADAAAALACGLAEHGYRERARVQHQGDAVFPELTDLLQRFPSAQAITWFNRSEADDQAGAAVFQYRTEPPGRWDPELARTLSRIGGGFAAAVEANRTRDEYGLAVFYAGRTVEMLGCDSDHGVIRVGGPAPHGPGSRELCDDEFMYGLFERYFVRITGGHPDELRLRGDGPFESWIVEREVASGNPYPVETPGQTDFTRIALANVEEPVFLAAVQALPAAYRATGWIWVARESPIAGIPYVLVQRAGPLDESLVAGLARACHSFAVGVQLGAPGLPFTWISLEPDGVTQRGEAIGASALVDKWAAFAITMGEPPGTIRWPGSQRGRAL